MEKPFDKLAKSLAAGVSRREAIRKAAALAAFAFAGLLGLASRAQAATGDCRKDKDCAPGYVCCNCHHYCNNPCFTKHCSPKGYCGSVCCGDPG